MNTNVSRTGMPRKRWEYLKALHPSAPKYLHVSARIAHRPNLLMPTAPPEPFVVRPGITYNVGRNKAKRERRADQRALLQRAATAAVKAVVSASVEG